MKQLNLVPVSIRQKARAKQAAPYLVLAGLVGLGLVGAAWVGFNWQLSTLERTKETLIQEEEERQQLAAKTADELKVDNDLTTRVKELNTLAKADVNWDRVFTSITALIPKDIKLTNYTVTTTSGSPVLKITGTAPSNVSITEFGRFLDRKQADKAIVSYSQDGYSYNPQDGSVAFSMTINVPKDSVSYTTTP